MLRPSIQYVKEMMGGRKAVGAEIGVENGVHAFEMLENLPLKKLILVDSYIPHYDKDQATVDTWKRNSADLLSRFTIEHPWIYEDSLVAAKSVDDGSLDFIYIDADHAEDAVYDDIVAWSKKVRVGGVVAGHDFATYEETRKAVIKYAQENDIEVYFRNDDWWFVKQ